MVMVLTIFLPLIILVFLGLFYFLMFKVGKKNMTMKITHVLLFSYIGILLVATIAVPFTSSELISMERLTQKEVDERMNGLYGKARKGDIKEIDPMYLKNEVSFPDYQSKELTIVSKGENWPQVVVEEKNIDDSKVDAYVYANGLIIDGIDFSDKLKPYKVELVGETVTIIPIFQELRLSIVTDSQPIRQFTGEKMFVNHSFSSGETIIYLQVPNGTTINEGNVYLEYVEK
ncbi:hypothetical protein [Bacillus sp. B15-48]|uniref:hypothetical protein n=1 Tax=Bacillus sp. B15-48 TaxID=1548601 RepID=UPI00193F419E|nr:hypothetical protein [Bacillus sp. B15-48]MBM4762782.1 hypothetical protein [Bacillus sp. B15-48]